MDTTLGDLAALLGGRLTDESAGDRRVRAIRSLAQAGPDDLSFFRGDPRYLEAARSTRAGAVLCDVTFDGAPCPLVVVEDAHAAMNFLLGAERDLQNPPPKPGVHRTAIVHPGADVGAEVTIGPYAVIEEGVRIGARTRILAHAFVGRGARLGEDCTLHPGAVVMHGCVLGARVVLWSGAVIGRDGFGFVQREGKHVRIPQVGGVVVGDDVEVGCWSSIDRGAVDPTIVESGAIIDSHCHVAHNCHVGENAILVGYARMGGSVTIGKNAILAQDAAVGERRRVGDGAIVGSAATVQYRDVKEGEIVLGFPARPALQTKRIDVLVERLPELFAEVRALRRALAQERAERHAEVDAPA